MNTQVMGILNVTPDSFSDGGAWDNAQAAIAHGLSLISAGATIIDIGGESTRLGARAVDPQTEWERIALPVKHLAEQVTVSVDTYHAQTAIKAVEAGAQIINDVTGGRADAQMFATVAELGCDYVLQHSRGNSQTMNDLASYPQGVVAEVIAELLAQREKALAAGIKVEQIILDPGLGFAKLGEQDWELLAGIEQLQALGHRVLVGPSRKRFVMAIAGAESTPVQRDTATAMLAGWLSQQNVWAVRVHNVSASVQAINAIAKINRLQTGKLQ